jgi:hypothetical protein
MMIMHKITPINQHTVDPMLNWRDFRELSSAPRRSPLSMLLDVSDEKMHAGMLHIKLWEKKTNINRNWTKFANDNKNYFNAGSTNNNEISF